MDFSHVKMILKLSMGLNLDANVVNVSLCYKCSLNLYLQLDQHLKRRDKYFCLSESINLTQWALKTSLPYFWTYLQHYFPPKNNDLTSVDF